MHSCAAEEEFSQQGMRARSSDVLKLSELKTAEAIKNFCKRQFPQVISSHIGLFKGWRVGKDDICGEVHQVMTKVPCIRKQESQTVCEEMQELRRQGVIQPFRGKPCHIIPWFTVNKKIGRAHV